jgi:Tfp pilus assembly protein PilF
LTAGENGTGWVWDLKTRRLKGEALQHGKFVRAVAVSPDGTVLLTGSDDCTVRLWDSATLQPVGQPIPHPNPIRAVAFSPDGKMILTGDVEGKVWRTDRNSPETPEVFFQHPAWVNALAWSPDGKMIASAGLDKRALLWDARTGQPFGAPLEHGDAVWGVAFSRNSDMILTGSWDGTARLWDVATQRPRGAPLQHGAKVEAVAISPDGRTIVTGGLDGRARLWDATTGIPIGPPLIHRDMVVGATFQTDGQTVLTGGLDSAAHVWPVAAPTQGSVADLVFQTQLLTGLHLEPGGAAVLLDAEIWSRYRQIPLHSFQMALAPFHAGPVYQRGQVYFQLGHLARAIDDWTAALRLCSGNSKMEGEIRALRGQAFWRLGHQEKAAEDYQKAFDLEFVQPAALNTLAWIYVMGPARIRNAERALPLARRAVDLDPKNFNYVNTLGVVYYRLGRYSEAVSELEKSVVENPVPPLDLFPLVVCYAHLGDLAKARASHDRATRWLEDHQDQLSPWDAADLKVLREEADQVLAESSEANRP